MTEKVGTHQFYNESMNSSFATNTMKEDSQVVNGAQLNYSNNPFFEQKVGEESAPGSTFFLGEDQADVPPVFGHQDL